MMMEMKANNNKNVSFFNSILINKNLNCPENLPDDITSWRLRFFLLMQYLLQAVAHTYL